MNLSGGSPGGSYYVPPGGALLGASLELITSGSFRSLLDGSNDYPPWGALLGASFEESGCGADS